MGAGLPFLHFQPNNIQGNIFLSFAPAAIVFLVSGDVLVPQRHEPAVHGNNSIRPMSPQVEEKDIVAHKSVAQSRRLIFSER